MRKAVASAALVLVLVPAFALAGCGGADKLVSERVDSLWKVNGPRLRRYIENDPALKDDADARRIRLETVDRMDAAVRDLGAGAP